MASNNNSSDVSKYNFLAEPNNALVCGICLEVAEEPMQHEKCGKLLCSECLEKYGMYKHCPNCREKRPQYFNDVKSKWIIKTSVTIIANREQANLPKPTVL